MPPTPSSSSNPITEAVSGFILHNITRVGVVGGGLYALATFGHAWIQKSWDEAFTGVGYVGLLLIVSGAAFAAKKTSTILVASEAEKRIADPALSGPPGSGAESVVPAIQREIVKQQTGTSETTTK